MCVYYRKAKQYHPDKNPSTDAHQKFQEITEAFEKINDEIKQKEAEEKKVSHKFKSFWRVFSKEVKNETKDAGNSFRIIPIVNDLKEAFANPIGKDGKTKPNKLFRSIRSTGILKSFYNSSM